MSRRREGPQVAKPSRGRRLIEQGKDLLILALTCSALFLVWQTPLATQIRGWVDRPTRTVEQGNRQPRGTAEPYGMAVRNSRGLYGAIYDADQVDRTFELLFPLLGEGLSTAGSPEKITRWRWQAGLGGPGVYCAFQGQPSLRVLSAWLGETNEGLTGGAQALLLTWSGDQVWLCWRQGEEYYRAPTQVTYEGHMDGILEEFSPNGAAFAYTLAETDRAYGAVDPDMLVSMTAPQPTEYTLTVPDLVGDRETLGRLLAALGLQSGASSAYEVSEGLAINEGGDRLRVSAAGSVVFHAGDEIRYPVTAEAGQPTEEEAALAAWLLLNRITEPWRGDAVYVLTGVEPAGEGWTVTFHSRLEGIPVQVGGEGWSASFTITGQAVSDFTLFLRSYTSTGEISLLPGQRLAAAALAAPVYRDRGRRLTLSYHDTGSAALTAGWVAEE